MDLSHADLEKVYDFESGRQDVERAVEQAMESPKGLVRFLARYTSWNAVFGAGVALLAAKIARSRGLFREPSEPIDAVADRSVVVASYFFDAARDEFDDRSTVERDTHRCLAQALMKGVIGWAQRKGALGGAADVNALLEEPAWLEDLQDRVAIGYGHASRDSLLGIFRSMGYHLGSEVMADAEFTAIDRLLRARQPELVRHLETTKVDIAGEKHVAYLWVSAHSGGGGAAEAQHFEWAMRGARLAFEMATRSVEVELRAQLLSGFRAFADDHDTFFRNVQSDSNVPVNQ
jgi:hypothetical protein